MKYIVSSTPTDVADLRSALGEQLNDTYELHMLAAVYKLPMDLIRYLWGTEPKLSILSTITRADLESLYPEYFI